MLKNLPVTDFMKMRLIRFIVVFMLTDELNDGQ